jgi:hypothetical protein
MPCEENAGRSQNKRTIFYKSGNSRHFRKPLKNKNCIRGETDSLMPVISL